jgi:hypothetical protein
MSGGLIGGGADATPTAVSPAPAPASSAPPPTGLGGSGPSTAGASSPPPKPEVPAPTGENKSPPGTAPAGIGTPSPVAAEEHSRFIPALGPPRTEDGTQLRPTPSGSPPPVGAGVSTIPPPADLGVTPAGSKVEPVGAAPRAIAPAIQAGAPLIPRADKPAPASAKSYSVTRYVCKAGDTFQSLSKDYYHREDFAAALQAFNRVDSHRCGSPALSSDGKLAAGDVVYVPMLAALESESAGYLPRPETTPASFPGP